MDEVALRELLKDMSPEEKIMQLYQLPGQMYMENAAVTGIVDDTTVPDSVRYRIGSTLGIWGAEQLKKIQDDYMEHQPHHIPLLFMLDVIHGHKTVMPCPLGEGATFDPELIKKGAAMAAEEASADGLHVVFSPMADLSRDARWGRCMESTGEDPYLNSLMTAAMVKGFQGDAPVEIRDPKHVASCVKHYAAYSAATAGRDYREAEISEYTLRDQYLKAYESGVKAGTSMVMTSFNPVNGIPASGNKWLMKDILRGEMGFDGVLISDWAAVGEMIEHGTAEDKEDAARLAFAAGVDIDMCADCYPEGLMTLLEKGELTEEALDESVYRVLKLKNALGLFEDPYHGASEEKARKLFLCEDNRAVARTAVQESLVLLKNAEGLLPIRPEGTEGQKVAFIGPYVEGADTRSSWSVSGDGEACVSLRQAAEEVFAGSGVGIRFGHGCMMVSNHTTLQLTVYENDNWEEENAEYLKEAAELAAWADIIVLAIGEDRGQSGESTSRAYLKIPAPQLELLEVVRKAAGRTEEGKEQEHADAAGKKIAALIYSGRPLELGEIADKTDALVECWLPGTEGGHGIMDVLTGAVNPQGKIPMSFPRTVGQEPIYYNMFGTGRPKPQEGLTNFTTRYLDCENDALYPFGYGLSYTEFEISGVTLSSTVMTAEEVITASATITNIGTVPAVETAQLYIRDLKGSRVRPVKELKGFKKVRLAPGESAEVRFDIREEMLRFYTAANRFASEPGRFRVFIGEDSTTENAAEFIFN